MAALKEDYERSLSVNAASQKDLQENLISSKHELLRVQEQLALAEKVHQCATNICPVTIKVSRQLIGMHQASVEFF